MAGLLLVLLANPLYKCALEFAHMLSHEGTPDHTLASHGDDSNRLTHSHKLLEKVHMALDVDLQSRPNHQTSIKIAKLHLICPSSNDGQHSSVADKQPYDRPYYQEALLPSLYIRTLLDPPELG